MHGKLCVVASWVDTSKLNSNHGNQTCFILKIRANPAEEDVGAWSLRVAAPAPKNTSLKQGKGELVRCEELWIGSTESMKGNAFCIYLVTCAINNDWVWLGAAGLARDYLPVEHHTDEKRTQ
jgi:hypothetical protein